jgi:transcriptional regulator with XRE-family HTH domain
MKSEGLSPSKFADEIGVQRATISHITSGRNAPSSNVIAKVLTRFPTINPDWLFKGVGQMKRNTPYTPTIVSTPLKTDLFGNTSNISAEEEKRSKYRINLTEKKIIQPFKPAEKENSVYEEKEIQVKAIEKITVFYSDNTYETFIPEKKDGIIS